MKKSDNFARLSEFHQGYPVLADSFQMQGELATSYIHTISTSTGQAPQTHRLN